MVSQIASLQLKNIVSRLTISSRRSKGRKESFPVKVLSSSAAIGTSLKFSLLESDLLLSDGFTNSKDKSILVDRNPKLVLKAAWFMCKSIF